MFERTEVQQKAEVALSARQAGDPRYDKLVEELMKRTGQSKDMVEQGIIALFLGAELN